MGHYSWIISLPTHPIVLRYARYASLARLEELDPPMSRHTNPGVFVRLKFADFDDDRNGELSEEELGKVGDCTGLGWTGLIAASSTPPWPPPSAFP